MRALIAFISLFYLLEFRVMAQINTLEPIEFTCDTIHFSIDYGGWGDPIQACTKKFRYDFFTNSVNFEDLTDEDNRVIEKMKNDIIERGGQDFFDKLELKYITRARNTKRCEGQKYAFRFIYEIDSIFFHRFILVYDEEGNLTSSHEFPEIQNDRENLNFIDYCSAIDIALSDSTFRKMYDGPGERRMMRIDSTNSYINYGRIADMRLGYDEELNHWTWTLYTETKYDGENEMKGCVRGYWIGKKIIIDAFTSEILNIDDYRNFKISCYF